MTLFLALLLAQACPKASSAPPPGSCHLDGLLQDHTCTPGATDTDDLKVICDQSTKERRCEFDKAVRKALLKAYGLPPSFKGEFDHLISIELGGSNDLANVWPESAPDFKRKDRLENLLHALVCRQAMTLQEARDLISQDWLATYNELVLKQDGGYQ